MTGPRMRPRANGLSPFPSPPGKRFIGALLVALAVGCTSGAGRAAQEGSHPTAPPPTSEQPIILTPTTALFPSFPEEVTPTTSPASDTDPDPFKGLRIAELAAREYGGTGIVVGEVARAQPTFTRYRMTYSSDDLTISGLVDIPAGEGPFPVVIVNHGYAPPDRYEPGFDSWRIADWLAERGYIALMPDYRNYGDSDPGPNPFHIGYAIDVLNLIPQVASLPQAAPGQIGIIGHSMGGEISLWPMVISEEVDAVVLYASMSGDVALNWAYRRRYWPVQRQAMNATALIYGTPEDNPEAYAALSPVNYLDRVRMPVMIHHGTADEWVPYEWSEELFSLMQGAGLDVTFWSYPDGGHTLRGSDFDLLMERNLAFFDEYVRGDVNSP